MARNNEIPDLLARYMEVFGETERWITVYELRTHFHLDESAAHAISGFLRRIYDRPFFSYQYRVKKIEKILVKTPQRRNINRYLVKKRPESRKESFGPPTMTAASRCLHATGLPQQADHELCTDHDAVKIFNKILHQDPGKTGVRVTP